MYDVSDRASFENIPYWIGKINEVADSNVEIILLGNKNDLINEQRKITVDEAEDMAARYGIPHFETSAKDAVNVKEAFNHLISNVIKSPSLQDKIT